MASALIVLVALAIFLSGRNAASPGTPTPTPALTYVWQDPNPVSAIQVVSGTKSLSLKKDVALGNWSITAPISQPADLFSVSGVADNLQKLQAQFSLTATTDLAQYGLDKDSLVVTVTFSDTAGTKRKLNIGNLTLDGSGYYVKGPDSNSVYVVSNGTIEPIRSWLTTPPIEQPTPTPPPFTIVAPTPTTNTTITNTNVLSGTTTLTGTTAPVITSTVGITSTGTVTATSPMTITAPVPVATPTPGAKKTP